jgi:hypothetical protein
VLHDPEMRYASPAQLSEKLPTSNRATNRPDLPGFAKFLRERLVRFQMLLRAFVEAGVPVLVGTDTETFGFPGPVDSPRDGSDANRGADAVSGARGGDAQRRCVRRACVGSAEQFGVLAAGMRADIVLLHADPRVDGLTATTVAGTMARGTLVSGIANGGDARFDRGANGAATPDRRTI